MSAKFVWRDHPLKLVGHLEDISKKKTLELAKKVFDGVVARTPVRTGSARASWRAAVGMPDLSRVVNSDPAMPLPPPVFPLSAVPTYGKVVISNSTPYIMPLEYGWSKKAPAGMVRVTLASLGIGLTRV